ncbi:MAG: hypothetical protein ACFFCZ_25475 [Promethearchaeota archaeon]
MSISVADYSLYTPLSLVIDSTLVYTFFMGLDHALLPFSIRYSSLRLIPRVLHAYLISSAIICVFSQKINERVDGFFGGTVVNTILKKTKAINNHLRSSYTNSNREGLF